MHKYMTYRDVGTGPTDPAAAGPKFHPQLKPNSCDQANKKFIAEQCMLLF